VTCTAVMRPSSTQRRSVDLLMSKIFNVRRSLYRSRRWRYFAGGSAVVDGWGTLPNFNCSPGWEDSAPYGLGGDSASSDAAGERLDVALMGAPW